MPKIDSMVFSGVTPNVVSGEVGYRTSAIPFEFTGGIVRLKQTPNIAKGINLVALGAGLTGTIWTPAAGFTIRLNTLVVSTTVTGLYTIKIGATIIAIIQLVGNQPFIVPLPQDGLCLGVANDALTILNGTAGAVTINGAAMGNEL